MGDPNLTPGKLTVYRSADFWNRTPSAALRERNQNIRSIRELGRRTRHTGCPRVTQWRESRSGAGDSVLSSKPCTNAPSGVQIGSFNQLKFTVGASRASADVTSKYSLASARVALAVSTCGNRRMKPL